MRTISFDLFMSGKVLNFNIMRLKQVLKSKIYAMYLDCEQFWIRTSADTKKALMLCIKAFPCSGGRIANLAAQGSADLLVIRLLIFYL